MELKDYFQVIRRHKIILIVCLTAALLSGILWLRGKPARFQGLLSVIANYQNQTETSSREYFKYNNYYGTLIAQSFNESISGLLKNAGVVQAVFEQAQLSEVGNKIQNPGKYFKSSLKSKHVTEVIFYADTAEQADKLSSALISILQSKADEFVISQGEGKLELGVEGPVVLKKSPPAALYLGIIAVLALGAALGLIFLLHYLTDEVSSPEELLRMLGIPLLGFACIKARLPLEENGTACPTEYIQLRDQLITRLPNPEHNKIGITGKQSQTVSRIITQLHRGMSARQPMELLDISDVPSPVANELLDKISKRAGLVYLPLLFSPNQTVEFIRQMDFLLLVLPAGFISRPYLRSVRSFLDQFSVPKGLILTQ